jgi:hypothetical protein
MSEHELEKLLGGFAADTLTTEEKQQLYAAALQDQQLFNALADEQALKELLADPAVRHRLLQALNQTRTSGAGSSLSWLDWFRWPAGLAYAGGLAAAVLAVVLGTKIYQDSLKQAAQSVATEDTKPMTPPTPAASPSQPAPTTEAELKAKQNAAPTAEPEKKEELVDKFARRERPAAPPAPQQQPASNVARDSVLQRAEQDEARRQIDAPAAALGKSQEPLTGTVQQKAAAAPAPLAVAPAPTAIQAQANAPTAAGSAASARALFYSAEPARLDQGVREPEHEQTLKSTTEARRSLRSESKVERFSATGAAAQLKPLGLRYGFAIREADGKAQETDAATALKSGDHARLSIEVNQDAYVQIWKRKGSSTPQLWFPTKETGQTSIQVPAGRRQGIPLTEEDKAASLTVRLSRVPLGFITEQEAATLDIPSNQLQETVTSHDPSGPQEQATYVVNQNPSPTVQLIVEIPLPQ